MKLKTVDVGRSSILLNRKRAASGSTQEHSNVAWFKLAEFVKRGEKERALSLYRLLTHSISDQSFLKRLEADIWASFDKKQAEIFYNEAAHLYKKEGRFQEALLIFESLVLKSPETLTYLEKVVTLSDQLGWMQKKVVYQKKLYLLWLTKGKVEKAFDQFKAVEEQLKDADCYEFHKQFVITALTHQYAEQKVIKNSLHKALDGFLRIAADKALQQFIEEIKALNSVWHKDATAYLKKQG